MHPAAIPRVAILFFLLFLPLPGYATTAPHHDHGHGHGHAHSHDPPAAEEADIHVHPPHEHGKQDATTLQRKLDALFPDTNAKEGETGAVVSVTEKNGETLPLSLSFVTADNTPVLLKDILDRPALILPLFFHCPRTCSMMLTSLADIINRIPHTLGKDYRIIAFSFDPQDSPQEAMRARKNTFPLIEKQIPEKSFLFLTGASPAIQELTAAMGYGFRQVGHRNFIHPNVMIASDGTGQVIRYLYGPDFLPFDAGMALTEAERGTPGLSIRKVLSYCFDYNPDSRRYVANVFRMSGSMVLLLMAGFGLFLLRGRKKTDDKKGAQ